MNVYKILYGLCFWMLVACTESGWENPVWEKENGCISLDISTGIMSSRATMEDLAFESEVTTLDVFISDLSTTDSPDKIIYYERVTGLQSSSGKVMLKAQKEDFEENTEYRVDVIANASTPEADFQKLVNNSWSKLKDQIQTDERIQLTGAHKFGAIDKEIDNVPDYFLMDGIAGNVSESNGNEIISTTAQLNEGNSEHTQLKVVLRRAAAKIVVNLMPKKDEVFFDVVNNLGKLDELTEEEKKSISLGALNQRRYNLRNMPYSTTLLEEGEIGSGLSLRNTAFFADELIEGFNYFEWSAEKVTITAYVYENDWSSSSFFENGLRMVVCLPMIYKQGEESYSVHVENYYQIVLSKNNAIERNNYYQVDATISMPGAIEHSQPLTLTELTYSTYPWNEQIINVGGDHRPSYLSVNRNELDMHNIAKDSTSLSFVSSSEVGVEIIQIWYIDKFGQIKNEADDSISVAADAGLSGNITVVSPVPVNNAIRYIKLKVSNGDESTEQTILVKQYPLEYITNIQGYYSYRSDFGGTTYEDFGENGYIAISSENKYLTSFSSDPIFGSKVATLKNNGTGESDIKWYFWYANNGRKLSTPRTDTGSLGGLPNARMYHVRITSTSNEYKVGIPKQNIQGDKHYTDTSQENNELVSPSFMIASQLGATQMPTSRDVAANHCAQYVETYRDDKGEVVHLTNWRLPTQKEIQIITRFQKVQNAAMDVVLSGDNYWSAAGIIDKQLGTLNSSVTSAAVRCIRDAY